MLHRWARLLAVLTAVLLATTLVSPASDADGDGQPGQWTKPSVTARQVRILADDAAGVDLDGGAPSAAPRAPMGRATGGYRLFDSGMGLNSSYTVRMVDDQPYSRINAEVAGVMAEIEYVTGVDLHLGPEASSHAVTGYNEIGVSVSSYTPLCGPLSNPGTIGCGVYYSSDGRVVNGEVYVCGCLTSDMEFGTVLHEFGHVLGLDHYESNYEGQLQVMAPYYQDDEDWYRSGDVNGLRRMTANGFGGGTAPKHPPGATPAPAVLGLTSSPSLRATWAGAPAYGSTINQHQVQVRKVGTTATTSVTVGSGRTADVLVRGGANYQARVRAHNSLGWGPWSAWSGGTWVVGRCVDDIVDVAETATFCTDIAWLLNEGIATGYADDTFRSSATVTRQAMAAFLMRDADRFAPGPSASPRPAITFSDVPPSHPFYDEIMWLASTGITTGYPDGTFRPDQDISRMAMAAMLQRFTEWLDPGSTAGDWSASPFSDVPPSKPFHDEITWLASTGITTGYPDGTFRPDDDITRQAMAAFLHRHDTEFG